ncbi:MAG: hypothetical protein PHX24_12230 [Acidithiobacillus sp.]|nr:hypothetical protein [Acidithiobacillus sp.]
MDNLSFLAWLWLIIPVAVGLLMVWVVFLELQQLYRNFRVWIRSRP